MHLDGLAVGQPATIVAVGGRGAFRRRMLELGLVPGTPVQRVGQMPLGDPITIRVRGAIYTLRRSEARVVEVA